MADTSHPPQTPTRPSKEFEDHHFHDDDEIEIPPADEADAIIPVVTQQPARPAIKDLPPRARRFYEE